jgi:importin subunit alpha-1
MLTAQDAKIVLVALEAIENILDVGERLATKNQNHENPYVSTIEEADGIDKIESLQSHENEEIYKKVIHILENYFSAEEESENTPQTFNINAMSVPQGGFVF